MNELLPTQSTDTLEEASAAITRRRMRLAEVESAASDEARVQVQWIGEIAFEHPITWTEAEAKDAFVDLSSRLARAQCIMIIHVLPSQVLPTILPQLQEMAEYETRMWEVRQQISGPDIHERWVSLPITT